MPHIIGLIPARLASTRLPRKLLLKETGQPLIQHTWEAARRSSRLQELAVATDSEEIAAAVRNFGGRCVVTGEHASGTDRIADAAARHWPDAEIVVNIQGDELELDPDHVDQVIELLLQEPRAEIATLATPIRSLEERDDPSCVKVAVAKGGRALYFSRWPIPYLRDVDRDDVKGDPPWLRHLGLYAYRAAALRRLAGLPTSRLESYERLEQLRALEEGMWIRVAVVDHAAVGIDTPLDYRRFVARLRDNGGG